MHLYGASGHAKVIMDILESQDIAVEKVYDDRPPQAGLMGIPVSLPPVELKDAECIICIGNNAVRSKIALKNNWQYGKAIHRNALVSPSVIINEGTVVMHGAIIQADSRIGKHVIINTGASVDHDNIVGDFCHISPQATLCGNVSVGEGTHIGAGAVIIPGIRIGKWAVVGAGSVVVRDVPDYAVVMGNPSRIKRYIEPE